MGELKNKGGRPRKHPVGPRTNLTVRLPTSLRDRLHAAAQVDGRSLAEMIERSLEASFTATDLRTIIREEIRAAMAERPAVSQTFGTLPPWPDTRLFNQVISKANFSSANTAQAKAAVNRRGDA